MLQIDFEKSRSMLELEKIQSQLEKIKTSDQPDFEKHQPDLELLKQTAAKYAAFKNVILIGNGGSRTSAWAFYHGLANLRNDVHFEFLSSGEPELIVDIRKRFKKRNTLILAISKSGGNINLIEPVLALSDYPGVIVSEEKDNTLSQIANRLDWERVVHPEVGGRFSAMTSCALFPAALMGLSIEQIYAGGQAGYSAYGQTAEIQENQALQLAAQFWDLEQSGYHEIFASIYSTALFSALPLIIQLIHETAGKNGHGQTIYGDYSPESQHHTNQRFFGGRKNAIGLFMGIAESDLNFGLKVPKKLRTVPLGKKVLGKLNGENMLLAMQHDLEGVYTHAVEKNIPAIKLIVEKITPESFGQFIVFWQYVSLYSAIIRDVDPYNQPEVERSKEISLALRFQK